MDKNKTSKFLALSVLFFGIALSSGALYYSYVKMDSVLTDLFVKYLQTIGESRAEQVKLFLDGKKNQAVDFSSDGFIKDSLYEIKNGNNAKEVAGNLSRHLVVNKLPVDSSFYKVLALGVNGVVVAATDNKSIGLDLSPDPTFLEGRSRPYVKSLSYDNGSSVKSLVLSAPVLRNGEFVGVVAIKMIPDALVDIMSKENNFSGKLETYIINKDGYLITPSKFLDGENKGVLTQVVDSENSKGCLKDIEKFYQSDSKTIDEHKEEMVVFKNYRGEDAFGMHDYIMDMKWCVLAEVDRSAIWEGRGGGFVVAVILFLIGGFIVTQFAVSGKNNEGTPPEVG